MCVEQAGLLREAHAAPVAGAAVSPRPRPGAIDRLAIRLEPAAEAFQPRDLLGGNLRVLAARPDIEQQVAVLRDRIDEARHQRVHALVIGIRIAAVVAEGMAQASRRLPFAPADLLETGVFPGAEIVIRRLGWDDAATAALR